MSPNADGHAPEPPRRARAAGLNLRALAPREFGFGVIARHVQKRLGIDRALRSIDRAHDDAFPFADILVAIALDRQVDAGMQQRALDKEVSRIQASLARDARVDGHGVSTCKLIANAQRRGLIKVNAKGDRYVLDRDRVRIERRRAGVHVIRSTLVEQPVARSLQVYDALYAIESDFRMLKTPLKLRPMHHRASRRIEAHMLMCGLALMLARELERRTGETLETLRRVFGTVRAVESQQGPTRFWQREEGTEDAQRLLRAVGAPEEPTTWRARRCEA